MNLLACIRQLKRPVFTTHEAASMSGKSLSAVTQGLNYLEREGLIFKIYRGIWAEQGNEALSPYMAAPFLFPRHRAYVSFISALHLHGIVEQIPQVITLASSSHTKTIKTRIGVFSIHKISPSFFYGFDWYRGAGSFLIAEPEKALVDCLYVSAYKKKQFGYFPELNLAENFSFKKAEEWARKIASIKVRNYVEGRLKNIGERGSV